jgi:LysR family transcriptional regulator, low CO2-responsive transcriptional regulator
MTPTQLRAFAAVVRLGSVKRAAAALAISEAAVSLHVGHLRREVGDKLFVRTAAGLSFTPGGLRLAGAAAEILDLQDRTLVEVSRAGGGRRQLRVATSALFAEYAAPGLIESFAEQANDLDVELSNHSADQFEQLLVTRTVDVAIGPRPAALSPAVTSTHFLNYQMVAVASPEHPLSQIAPGGAELREQTWLLGPSATSESGIEAALLERLKIPADHQRIFQSHSAAVEEAKRGKGVALAVSFAVSPDLAHGDLKRVATQSLQAAGEWSVVTLAHNAPDAATELARFATTARATQAMLRGGGVSVGRFSPSIHITRWS